MDIFQLLLLLFYLLFIASTTVVISLTRNDYIVGSFTLCKVIHIYFFFFFLGKKECF